jgi:hypothetical protein
MINNLPQASDFAIVGAQFAALGSSDNVSLFVGTRNAVTPQLRIAPTVRLGYSSKNDDTEDWLFGPSVRLDYRWKQWFQTQLELGANFSLLGQPGLDKTEFDQYYVLAGYRLDF